MNEPLAKSYEPAQVEPAIRKRWESAGYFRADPASSREPFCMVIPPPNVTGSLHMGHALNNTLQDILARYKRMDGYEVLWLPGTDHAGIATQNVVERELAKEGRTRQDLGREKFLERVWQWKETYGGRILEQLGRLGCSCDFSRTRFTMDDGLSVAVREVFVRLWDEGLLYRGDYIVNWCPRCGTALSDIEVQYKEIDGSFYHIRYPFDPVPGRGDSTGEIVVATTRPETMLGDTAVAVHPDDARHRHLIGKKLRLPILGRIIPIIADAYVDPSFGTGLVKITPAHDPNDFLIGRRHSLPLVNILNPDATLNDQAGPYAGQDRFVARKGVVERLKSDGLLVSVEPHRHNVGHCYRCSTPIEPFVSKQWFVRMKSLADPAIEAVKSGRIRLHPARWMNDYLQWMENIRDWCISRQIWWGHRIPAWYCSGCLNEQKKEAGKQEADDRPRGVVVARDAPARCPDCGSTDLRQDDDVLDTWFSSALWPFSTLGWPADTAELRKFYPTSVLSTGFDILTFWVSRMIVMGLHFMNDRPFRDVPIHALIRTETGEKMSKSQGNVIDPLDMMDKYGTDAVRFTLTALAAQGRDIKLSERRFEGYRHFANKLWNAARFTRMNITDAEGRGPARFAPSSGNPLADLCNVWILGRLDATIRTVRQSLDDYEFDSAARSIYDFIWGEYCDWYIEISKLFLNGPPGRAREETQATLVHVLAESLKLLHPFMPFVTEELWSCLPGRARDLAVTPYPTVVGPADASDNSGRLALILDVIRQIRAVRALYRVPPNRPVTSMIRMSAPSDASVDEDRKWLELAAPLMDRLAKARCEFKESDSAPGAGASCVFPTFTLHVQVGDVIDIQQEQARLRARQDEIRSIIRKNEARLKDPDFLDHAPDEVIETMRERTESLCLEMQQMVQHLG